MASPNIILRSVMFAVWLVLLVICVLAYTGTMGDTISDVAKKNDTPLTPEAYTFYSLAIIGVLEGVGCMYALFPHGYEGPKKDRWKTKTVESIGPWWVIGFTCQILWLILWVQSAPATRIITLIISLGLQVAGLASFAIAYGLLMKMTSEHGKKSRRSVSVPSYILFYIPTVMNLAWLTLASCIGLSVIIHKHHKGWSSNVVAIILAAIATFVGLLIEGFHVSVFYGLTLIWTFTGLYIRAAKHPNDEPKSKMMEEALLVFLILMILITAFSIVVSIFRFFRKADDKEEPLKSSSSSSDDEAQEREPVTVV